MTREVMSLAAPPADCNDLKHGPPADVPDTAHRCSQTRHPSPWNFSCDGGGRFDLEHPEGTCYLASDDVGALRETLGPDYKAGSIVSADWFALRRLWELENVALAWVAGVADLLNDWWDGVGLTNELFVVMSYESPQAWAKCFRDAGWEGLRVRLRHMLDSSRFGIVLFGDSGPTAADPRFTASAVEIDPAKLARFVQSTGIRVEGAPVPKGHLHVIS